MSDRRRVLLDECVPAKLRREIPGHGVRAVREYGCVDRNLVHQQNLSELRLGIVVLIACKNSVHELRKLLPEPLSAPAVIQPGQVIQIGPLPEHPSDPSDG